MKKVMFSIRDIKANAYCNPFFMSARGEAVRAFADLVEDVKTGVNKHPEDYELFEIGEFDDCSGLLVPLNAPIFMHSAIEFVRK